MLMAATAIFFTGCGKDYVVPVVTAPTAVQSVANGQAGNSVTFNVTVDPDLTATYTATGSNVTVTNATGTVSGTSVTINYDASTVSGAAAIVLKVTDSEGQTAEGTAVINIGQQELVVTVSSNVTANTTWTTGKTYILAGRITVTSGATLTIQPGVVVKGQAGTGANATALLIARGAKIMAEGTAARPIVFTSVADEITPENIAAGNFGSPNLGSDVNGLWGGLIILGRAPISASNAGADVTEVQIEGIPTSDPNGLYGGNDPADNSGVVKYVSLRHGGTNIGSGNEINGLTLGGVGSGTVIENVEIVSNQDDGIEWFGGTVSVKNALVWNVGDDGIDTDQAWSGTLDNFIVVTPLGHCFELDGPEGTRAGSHTIKNGSVIASDATRTSEDLINVDANSAVTLKDIYITGIGAAQKINRVTAPLVFFEGITLNVAAADLANHVNGTVPAGVTVGTTPKANAAAFGWTWASKAGALTGL